MRHRTRIALLLAGFLPGCYWEPPTGEIMVATAPPGASCVVSQLGKPLGIAEPTPAIAIATLIGAEIDIVCRRPGFAEAAVTIPPPLPAASLPGYNPNRRPEIDYHARVDITMTPAPPGGSPPGVSPQHCRLAGCPGRTAALERFLHYAGGHGRVWITRRIDIALYWIATHPFG